MPGYVFACLSADRGYAEASGGKAIITAQSRHCVAGSDEAGWCRRSDLNREARLGAGDFKSPVFTISPRRQKIDFL